MKATRDEPLRWAEDLSKESGDFIWAEDAPAAERHFITKCSSCGTVIEQCRCRGPHEIRYAICEDCQGKTAVRNAPSKPYLTDEYEPTDPNLWERCLEVVNGKRREFTRNERTIHSPNHGRGYRHMPNPKGIAWAVKQYNGFNGGWKSRKLDEAHTAALRILVHGGVVQAAQGDLDALGRRGFARVAGEARGRVYWDITARGRRVALAGLVDELTRRMKALLSRFDPAEAKTLGEWLDSNFRVSSPKTPKGGKALKDKLQRLVWVLKFRHGSVQVPDPTKIVDEIRKDWEFIEAHRDLLVKFTDEGGTIVPKELDFDGVKYVNDAGVSEVHLDKYAKRLSAVFAMLKGWRKKALSGNLTVVLKPASAFRGTVGGKYKRDQDALWVRTTPAILRRAQGYGSFEYIIVHELGHRFEKFSRLPRDFDRPEWWTTRYSHDEGESFAELFAIGHFSLTGNWDEGTIGRFEGVMG